MSGEGLASSPYGLAGRAVLVTGASSGIGLATCAHLARLGARVWLVGRDEARLTQARAGLAGAGHVCVAQDLADPALAVPAWMKALAREHGPLHGVVHSAGAHALRPLRAQSPAVLDGLYQLNVRVGVELVRGLCQRGVRVAEGPPVSVVLLASVAGLVGMPAVSAYAASKGALVAAARALAVELAREGVRVNCVAPGTVETPMTARLREALDEAQFASVRAAHPLGLGRAEDVAYAVGYLLSDAARWVTGTTLVVDGGYTAQ